MMVVAGLGAVGSLFLRFLRARGDERQQIKWFAWASAPTFCLIFVFEVMTSAEGRLLDVVFAVLSLLLVPAITVATGIAILKYRLYDIDRIVNRTLVYGVLTASLVLVYLGGVISLRHAFRVLSGGSSQLAVVVSTLVIAALFNPLRRRIQSFIDRRFYRHKYGAARTLADFGARLRNETDLDALNGELVSVVRETMQPAAASLWLRPVGRVGGGER